MAQITFEKRDANTQKTQAHLMVVLRFFIFQGLFLFIFKLTFLLSDE